MRRKVYAIIAGCAAFAIVVGAGLFSVARHAGDTLGLGGTNVTERDLTRAEQLRLLDNYAPFPTPTEATDIRLRYQRFQDIFFDGSFALPPDQYDAYVRRLTPLGPTVGVAPGAGYAGRVVGAYTSVVAPDPATYRIRITYVAG